MLTDQQLLSVWEVGYQRSRMDQAFLLVSSMLPELNQEEVHSMTIGKRDGLLMRLRRRLFGNRCESLTCCPQCDDQLEINFLVSDLIRSEPDTISSSFEFQANSLSINYRLLTGQDAFECTLNSHESTNTPDTLLQKCILSIHRDGKEVGTDSLTTDEKELIANEVAKQDPLSNIQFELECTQCQSSWVSPFDIVSFLWNEITQYCQRLLCEIHTLAKFYSWNEGEILSLSRWRRQIYLNMARQQ